MLLYEEFETLDDKDISPVFLQYKSIKSQYKSMLVFFRMGDFYEFFFDDAIKASTLLNIALTHKGTLAGKKIPMAGIPHHQKDNYFQKLIDFGYKAVICEQKDLPDDSKLITRYVDQIIGPGIPYNFENIQTSYIASFGTKHLSLLSMTEAHIETFYYKTEEDMKEAIKIHPIKEILCPSGYNFEKENCTITTIASNFYNKEFLKPYLKQFLPFYEKDHLLEEDVVLSLGILCFYLKNHYFENFKGVLTLSFRNAHSFKIFQSTYVDLEILPKKEKEFSLIHFMNETLTPMGFRKLQEFFFNPLLHLTDIQERMNHVEKYFLNYKLLEESRVLLKSIKDCQRILTKIALGKALPTDITTLAISLIKSQSLCFLLYKKEFSKDLENMCLKILDTLLPKNDHPFVSENSYPDRDKYFQQYFQQEECIKELEEEYKIQFSLKSLKIKTNKILGYFLEINKREESLIPDSFKSIQSLTGVLRYSHDKLTQFEKLMKEAQYNLEEEEIKILKNIQDSLLNFKNSIIDLMTFVSHEDVYQAFAYIAQKYKFSRPEIHSHYEIQDMFHPLVKKHLSKEFVSHTIDLPKKFHLITGPNMGGKTTFMRELALLQFLAHIGSYVPANIAKLPLVDGIFSRLGGEDNIQKGESTFMVEMSQMSLILRHATEHSLILVDEIGRGTAIQEGLALAKSFIEYFIVHLKGYSFFSTHFHELIEFIKDYPEAQNLSPQISYLDGKINFLYHITYEGSSKSYAFEVAELAGIHSSIIEKAKLFKRE